MRRAASLVAMTLIIFGGLLQVTSAPVYAEPAQPYTYDDCVDFSESDVLHTICFQTKGVVSFTETPSGIYRAHDSGETCFQHYVNGALVEEGCRRFNFVVVAQGSQAQVDRWNIRFQETEGGVTCTGFFLFHYANDAIRRDVTVECT
jgi:hypothetical protein